MSIHTATLPELLPGAYTTLGSEVYRGLTARPKTLSPWLFYDREGSRLFEEITELDEYYVTRTERGIFETYADEIVASAAGDQSLTVLELGAGTATKTGILLAAAVRRQGSVVYNAIDVSESALAAAKANIEEHVAGVRVVTRTADYTEGLGAVETLGEKPTRKLVLYIGSSIGNFDAPDAMELLRGVRSQLMPGDRLLLGVDMVKDLPTLLAAYDDAKGVTAAFNRNVLARINRELGADFHPQCFRHKVRWNGELSRIEMHLESLIRQTVHITALGMDVSLRRGETIHTENSYKFTQERIAQMLTRTGFQVDARWTDAKKWFSVVLAQAV
jgi:dimethylhistidine N-methyltransferase